MKLSSIDASKTSSFRSALKSSISALFGSITGVTGRIFGKREAHQIKTYFFGNKIRMGVSTPVNSLFVHITDLFSSGTRGGVRGGGAGKGRD